MRVWHEEVALNLNEWAAVVERDHTCARALYTDVTFVSSLLAAVPLMNGYSNYEQLQVNSGTSLHAS